MYISNIGRADLKLDCPQSVRICSIHFADGRPTELHPYPTLHMGYDDKKFSKQKGRREIVKQTVQKTAKRTAQSDAAGPSLSDIPLPDCPPEPLGDCRDVRIKQLQERIACLETELESQQKKMMLQQEISS